MESKDKLIIERKEILRLAKKERNAKHYADKTKKNEILCDTCKIKVSPYYYQTHIKTTRHKKWFLLQQEEMSKCQ